MPYVELVGWCDTNVTQLFQKHLNAGRFVSGQNISTSEVLLTLAERVLWNLVNSKNTRVSF